MDKMMDEFKPLDELGTVSAGLRQFRGNIKWVFGVHITYQLYMYSQAVLISNLKCAKFPDSSIIFCYVSNQ